MTRPLYPVAVLILLTGILLPENTTLELLRGTPLSGLDDTLREQLQTGITLLRICLVALGITTAIVGSLPGWRHAAPAAGSRAHAGDYLPPGIIIIVLTATALRLYKLEIGLWIDEIATYVNYAGEPFGVLVSTYDSQNHHILYSLLAHASFLLFGEGAWALRLPAVLFGVGSIIALYAFAREFVPRREAILAAALMAFSYHHVWFSQNARGYTALLLFGLLSSWLLVRALREQRLDLWLWYAIMAALGVYVHMTMLFMVVGHFLIFLWQRLRESRIHWRDVAAEFLAGFCMAGLLTLTLYALVLPQLLGGTFMQGVKTTIEIWTNPIWTILELIRNLQIGFAGSLVAAIAGVVFFTGLYRFYREQPLVVQLLVVPAAVTICAILLLGHPMFPRTFFFLMGFGVMVVVRGTLLAGAAGAGLLRLRSEHRTLAATALCVALIAVSALSVPAAWAPKQDHEGARDYVMRNLESGDAIATAGVAALSYKSFYHEDWPVTGSLAELDAVRAGNRRTWFLYSMPLHMEAAYPDMWLSLQSEFTLQQRFPGTLGDGALYVVLSDKPPPARP